MTSFVDPEQATSIGAEIRRIRGDRTQKEFADFLQVGRTTIIRYEKNETPPDANFLILLYEKCGVDPTRIILGYDSVHIGNKREMSLLEKYRAIGNADKALVDAVLSLAANKRSRKASAVDVAPIATSTYEDEK